MIIGIDVGGTHTDGVLLVLDSDNPPVYKVHKTCKMETDHQELEGSILKVLDYLTEGVNRKDITRIVLSTTLSTNTIIEHNHDPVGLIIIPGPGLNPGLLLIGEENASLNGYINHRGQEEKPLVESEISKALKRFQEKGITNLAIVGKFSPRNPGHELKIKDYIMEQGYNFKHITLGHELSGTLNFPRRVATAYYNAAISSVHHNFITSIKKALSLRNIKAEVVLLKCDGGTLTLAQAARRPVATVKSGPAASLMGNLAFIRDKLTSIALDIGGTTTDIGLFIDGVPAFVPGGIKVGGLPTLVRGLFSRSIPCGGDSEVRVVKGQLTIGPRRRGIPASKGGPSPTPTDALVALGLIEDSKHFNYELAVKSLSPLYDLVKNGLIKKDNNEKTEKPVFRAKKVARLIIDRMSHIIEQEINNILTTLENQPVYTIRELLENFSINPRLITGMGGPARALIPRLASKMGYDYIITPHSGVANAIGAGAARPTVEVTVRADTATGQLTVPETGLHKRINRDLRLNQVEEVARKELEKLNPNPHPESPVEITQRESFNVIRGFRTLGRIIEVKAQVKPGLIARIRP
ncbi:hydantoinase/oxoprolinase family protein [Halothermothrix orenii]|uniref:N-methylhydantoinase (ATP-hydrolyzing) n=1 Tax=Halothermothrix orenii (strain H 168 / OCM 544 / DSM 9562) TaxID=373903 RepID=B8D0Q4_HALOH|nr:hydantoinase/oxoprolinase family protein [Halothermothrix orenii]ACL70990.1 N-methylhydantoinase (ATP-hydrolyzing) [Halothermothrix orenii H 168]